MAENRNKAGRRPFSLHIIAVLQVTIALLLALALLGVEESLSYLKVLFRNPFFSWAGWVLVGFLALAILGLLWLKRWGWVRR